jgi:hypothetical protein
MPEINTSKTNICCSFFAIFIVFAQYSIWSGGYNIGLLVLFFISVYYFIKTQKIFLHNWILILIIFCLFSQLFIHQSITGVFTVLIILTILLCLGDKIDEDKLYVYYKFWGTIAILGILYHSVMVFIFKQSVSPIRLGLSTDLERNWADSIQRPMSFFSEPQAFASYVVPFLFLSLRKNELKWAAFITLSILLSTSTQGIVMMLILWGGYFVSKKSFRLRNIITFSLLFFYFFLTPASESFKERTILKEGSTQVRIMRGFDIFETLSFKEKILGVGFGSVGEYVYGHERQLDWSIGNHDLNTLGFISGFSGFMVQFGILGTLLLIIMFYKFWRKYDSSTRSFLIMIFAAFFSQNMVFNVYFLYFFLFYLGMNKQNGYYIKFNK